MSVASMSISELLEQRTLIDTQICLKTGGSVSGPTKVKLTKGGKAKKEPGSRAGKKTANGDFLSKISKEKTAEIEEFKAANPEKTKGVIMSFVSQYKKDNEDEWKAFKAAWEEANPKDESKDSEASDDGNTMVTASSTSDKPKKVLTPEHKAAMQAGRLAAKAAKAAKEAGVAEAAPVAAPVAAPSTFSATTTVVAAPVAPTKKAKKVVKKTEPIVEAVSSAASVASEDDAPELIPFKHGGMTYMRLGSKREDGNHLWATADLWANKKGVKGDYVGSLQDDGTIDTDALEPLLE